MKKFLSLLCVLAMALSMTACGGGSDEGSSGESGGDSGASGENVLKIGVFEPMTGGNAAAGQLELEGVQLANHVRPTVDVGGTTYTVELVVADTKTDTVEAVTAAASLVSAGCVAAIGGSGSGLCIAAAPTFEEGQLPIIGTTCTNPLVTEDNTYYFRLCFTDPLEGEIISEHAKQNLGAKTAAIICDVTDTYTIGLAEYFKASFGEENIVEEVYFNTGDQDFTAALATIAAADPDVVFSASQYTEGALMQVQAEQQGLDLTFLGTDGWETDALLEIGGSSLDGCAFVSFFDNEANPTEASTTYLEQYDEYFGGTPASSYTALAYDCYMIIMDALEACGSTDGPTLRDAIAATDRECVTGPCTFDDNGDAVKEIGFLKSCQDGQFVSGGMVTLGG